MKKNGRSICILVIFSTFFLSCCLPSSVSCAGVTEPAGTLPTDGAPKKNETPARQQESPPLTLVDINQHINELPKRLIDLKQILEDTVDVDAVRSRLPAMEKRIEDFSWQVNREKSNPSLSYSQLAEIAAGLDVIKRRLQKFQDQVTRSLDSLSAQDKSWQEEKTLLKEWKRQAGRGGSEQLVLAGKKKFFTTVNGALKQLEAHLFTLIELSRELASLDARLYSINTELKYLIDDARGVRFEQTSPSIFSKSFYRRIQPDLVRSVGHGIIRAVHQLGRFFRSQIGDVFLSFILVLVFATGISRSGRLVEHSNRWFSFSRRPVATSIFVFLSLFLLATTVFSARHLATGIEGLLSIITIAMIIRLSGILVDSGLRSYLLLPMAFVLILSHLLQLFHVPAALVHLYIFLISSFGVLWYLNIVFRYRGKLSGGNLLLLHLAGLFSTGIAVAEIAGYSAIAIYLFRSFLYSVIAALDFWFLFLFTQGLLELFFYRVPLRVLKKNSNILAKQCVPVLSLFYIALFFLVSLVNWQIYPTIDDAAVSLANIGFSVGGFKITPGYILAVLLVVYVSFFLSKMLQALLLQEVLPRYGAEIGVQLSITRLVHYAVLVVGFLVLLRVLGVQLNKLAILGGALGVGIGFGLQAIVNNFASGLILLFERPLKVGDMIQVGADMGEVKKLGLRATVVRTFDNADIVIPNSDLITGQVTNWTFADRHIRVKVPVGVAYGTDIAKVLEILQGCAENNPMVLNQPKARALFLAFGDSSLDFELRVWIAEFTDRRQALSELNQDIDSEFSSAGIEIPFPQSDLHLRSVDAGILKKVRPV